MKQQLLDTLEQIAGKENIHPNEPMSRHTTFRVGGPADVLVTPEAGKLAAVTGACREAGEPYYIVGNGSNLLVGDGGIRGVVILTRDGMDEISVRPACGLRREREHSCHARRRLLRHMR